MLRRRVEYGACDKEPTVNRPHVGKQEINEGIFLVIHKITDGLPVGRESIDRQYVTIAEDAQCAGIQWGAYHFSRYEGYNEQTKLFKRPPKEQAEYFVARVYQNKPANAASVLLAWDFEADNGEMMSIPAMAVAVEEVQLLTGKYPGIYVNGNFARKNLTMKGISRSLTNDALARLKNPQMKTGAKKVLQKCWLWVARYDHLPPEDFATDTPWEYWTMWQYTTNLYELAHFKPHPIRPHPGLRHDVAGKSGEFNYIAKSRDELNRWYAEHAWNYDLRDKTILAKYP